jgi:hypothetical protein
VVLTYLFYELAIHPEHIALLREELSGVTSLTDQAQLKNLPHLNGAINEAMRMHPPLPSGFRRDAPPGGVTIGDVYIPGGTTIVVPNYTVGRCTYDDTIRRFLFLFLFFLKKKKKKRKWENADGWMNSGEYLSPR